MREPEPPEGGRKPKRAVRICLEQPLERGAEVRVVALQALEPERLVPAGQLAGRPFGQLREVAGVATADLCGQAARC